MILYHGSIVKVENPMIIKTEQGRDFGYGFYTTEIKEQAIRWAIRKRLIARKKGHNEKAIVSIYDFNENARSELKILHYPEPTLEWLDMICACRQNPGYQHGYDIVIGKIANDNVGETVSYVAAGVMRREDALERLKFQKINNQFCFNTERALNYLNYTGYEEFEG